ncbi:hypothetical protein pipiens_010630 [Culex pipiens pipiens]|uniref:Endonuclease/exonuclease/phosphatase domain-containing protein n=1 Tax=Culex pipiens pipiens TaxID=38569 RepID=A0ABD1D9L1_CULPP
MLSIVLEQTCVKINFGQSSLIICTVYLSPSVGIDRYELHANCIEQLSNHLSETDSILLVGDYNLPDVTWFHDDDLGCLLPLSNSFDDNVTKEKVVLEAVADAGLQQINYVVNKDNKRLDLAFVSESSCWDILEPPIPLLGVDAYHPPLLLNHCCVDAGNQAKLDADDRYDFGRCNFDRINQLISAIDWNSTLSHRDPENAAAAFYDHVYQILQAEVPLRRPPSSRKFEWWNSELSKLKNQLRKAQKKFCKSPNPAAELQLSIAESKYKDLHRTSYRNYLETVQQGFKRDPSSFWSYVRSKKGVKGLSVDLTYKAQKSSSAKEAAQLCADFFKTTFVQHEDPVSDHHLRFVRPQDLTILQPRLTRQDVLRALSQVNTKKGPEKKNNAARHRKSSPGKKPYTGYLLQLLVQTDSKCSEPVPKPRSNFRKQYQ